MPSTRSRGRIDGPPRRADERAGGDALTPSAEVAEPQVAVAAGSITNPDTGEQNTHENKPKIRREAIEAPAAGSLTLTALKDQIVSTGDDIGSVAPGTLSVTGTLTPAQQDRLLAAPSQAAGLHPTRWRALAVNRPPVTTRVPGAASRTNSYLCLSTTATRPAQGRPPVPPRA